MMDKKPHICHECGSEFYVFPAYEDVDNDRTVDFCPYCGSELYTLDDDLDDIEGWDD